MLSVEAPPGQSTKREEENLRRNNVEHESLNSKELKERFPELSYGPGYRAVYERTAGILMADKCLRHLQVLQQ